MADGTKIIIAFIAMIAVVSVSKAVEAVAVSNAKVAASKDCN